MLLARPPSSVPAIALFNREQVQGKLWAANGKAQGRGAAKTTGELD